MQTHTVFTLLDGSQHDTINKAKEHWRKEHDALELYEKGDDFHD
jgi:hypothetical protein